MTTEPTFPRLDALEAAARRRGRLAVAVAYPCSTDALAAVVSAWEADIIDPVLVGPRQRIESLRQRAAGQCRRIPLRRGG